MRTDLPTIDVHLQLLGLMCLCDKCKHLPLFIQVLNLSLVGVYVHVVALSLHIVLYRLPTPPFVVIYLHHY